MVCNTRKRQYNQREDKLAGFGQKDMKVPSQMSQTLSLRDIELTTKTLYSYSLSKLENSTNANDTHRRQRQINYLNGADIKLHFKNKQTNCLHVNVAVIIPKYNDWVPGSELTKGAFFRSDGRNNDRHINFDSTLSAVDFAQASINTDAFTVLYHKRILLNSKLGSAAGTNTAFSYKRPNYYSLQKYIPIKKVVRYDNGANEPETGRILLLVWCNLWDNNGLTVTPSALEYDAQATLYFKGA